MAEHCGCCARGQGFGARRLRIYLLLVRHPELDRPDFWGEVIIHTERPERGGVRAVVREDHSVGRPLPLVEIDSPVVNDAA